MNSLTRRLFIIFPRRRARTPRRCAQTLARLPRGSRPQLAPPPVSAPSSRHRQLSRPDSLHLSSRSAADPLPAPHDPPPARASSSRPQLPVRDRPVAVSSQLASDPLPPAPSARPHAARAAAFSSRPRCSQLPSARPPARSRSAAFQLPSARPQLTPIRAPDPPPAPPPVRRRRVRSCRRLIDFSVLPRN
jgi:hypothetical protein